MIKQAAESPSPEYIAALSGLRAGPWSLWKRVAVMQEVARTVINNQYSF
jgi:hypothetical protein